MLAARGLVHSYDESYQGGSAVARFRVGHRDAPDFHTTTFTTLSTMNYG
jgi:hypothetical protein